MAAYNLLLSSSYDECRKLQDYLEVMSEREGFSKAFRQELTIVVKEAFINAVQHGNAGSNADAVSLLFELRGDNDGRSLMIEVADSGAGFAIHEIDDPTCSESLMKSSGRGVFFIRAFAEILGQECDDNGCRLRLRMKPY